MNYKVNILGKTYDLPARTLAVDEQIEAVGSLDAEYKAKRMTRREVVERMHASPVESHTVEMPYGLGSITYEAMIESGTDELIPMDDGTWWGNLSVSIRAKKPQRLSE